MNEVKINNELGATERNSRQRCRRAVNSLKHQRKFAADGVFIRCVDVESVKIGQRR